MGDQNETKTSGSIILWALAIASYPANSNDIERNKSLYTGDNPIATMVESTDDKEDIVSDEEKQDEVRPNKDQAKERRSLRLGSFVMIDETFDGILVNVNIFVSP